MWVNLIGRDGNDVMGQRSPTSYASKGKAVNVNSQYNLLKDTMFSLPRYHRVSQEAGSDEEVTVFELPRLRGTDFGGGVYNKDVDLDLPTVSMLRPPKRYSRTQSVLTVCAFILVLLVVLGVAVGFIVYGSQYDRLRTAVIKTSTQPPATESGINTSSQTSTTEILLMQPSPTLVNTHEASPTLVNTHEISPTLVNTHEASPTLVNTHEASPTLVNTHEISPTLVNTHESSSTPENTHESSPTPENTHESSSTPENTHESSSTPENTHEASPTLVNTHEISSTPENTHEISSTPENTHESSSTLVNTHESSSTPENTHEISPTPENTHEISPTPENTHEISSTPVLTVNETAVQNSTGIPLSGNDSSQSLPSPTEAPTFTLPSTNDTDSTKVRTGISWEREFFPALTECTVQLYDMNRDGTLDVLVVDGFSSCAVKIVALDGKTGETVWEHNVTFEAFAVKCELDVNSDEVMDCLVCGRYSGFVALNGLDGSTLWAVDPSISYARYNFYFPLIVQDLDGDGTKDLINMHGGDTTYSDSQTDRSPAFLVVVSGRTGQKLMPRVPVPDGHESYMSPVLHMFDDGVEAVLFGSGGETLPGALWAMTLGSIQAQVHEYTSSSEEYAKDEIFTNYVNHPCSFDLDYHTLEAMRPTFDPGDFDMNKTFPGCPQLGDKQSIWNNYSVCVYELYRTVDKGMILPPVIVEMTGDGHDDIVAVPFDGHFLVMDGKDASIVWDKETPDTESYTVPAPLYYNDDSTIDLLVRVNVGHWMEYNSSYMAVLDGRNGRELWTLDSVSTGMMSGLSLAAAGSPGHDGLVFITIGREAPIDMGEILNDVLGKEFGGRKRRSRDDRTCHVYFDDLCLWDESGREKRHDDEDTSGEVKDEEMDYSVDMIQETLKNNDPPNLWAPGPYPDPSSDLEGFLLDCGHSVDELSAYVYFLTRDVIESREEVRPLEQCKPYVFQYPSERARRHSTPSHHSDNLSYKDLRCAHIEAPSMIPPSPAIADLDGDGRLEVAYVMLWGTLSQDSSTLPPRMAVKVFTLEEQFSEVYGTGAVDFSQFLPTDQQPWTHYMGAQSDNVYRRLHRLHESTD